MATRKRMPGQSSLSGIDWGQFDAPEATEKPKPARIANRTVRSGGRYRAGKKLQTPAVFTQEEQARPTEWHHMDSSRVMAARYDPGNQQIQVYFRDGTPWVYEDVPVNVYDLFITAASAGRFVNQVLNNYPYRRPDASEMGSW